MAPAFLIAGATGNTGRAVVETLSGFLKTSTAFAGYRVLALTRSSTGEVAQKLAQLPSVEVAEKSWVEITADWLRENNVESTFRLAALHAGVEYVVRISTTAANVRPDYPSYYPRTHWAIESLLSSPEFDRLRWTSLQPNVFTQFTLMSAAGLIKKFRDTGKQETLRLMASEDAAVGIIDSNDVGIFAAHLLVTEDVSPHNKAKYVLNGPENISGRQIVALTEEYIGTKVENVMFKDTSFIEYLVTQSKESPNVIRSIRHAAETAWEGKCGIDTTSKEVLQIAPPKSTPAQVLKTLLSE